MCDRGAAKMEFDVAVIKLSDPTHVGTQIFTPGPGRLIGMTATLYDGDIKGSGSVRVSSAHVPQVTKGPVWCDSEKFDITARTDERVTNDQLKLRLQALLTERSH